MKILYHHRTAADDGQAVHIRELQAAMTRAGHELREVALVSSSKRRSLLGSVADAAPRFVRELMEHAYDPVGRRALRRAADEFRPDVLYERYALSTACGAAVAKEKRIPYVLEVNSPLVDEVARTRGLSFPALARRKETAVLRAADRVAVVSGALRDWAAAAGADPARIVLTPNGVDLERFAPGPKDPELVARYGLAGRTVIGFTGFLRDWHRLELALDAIAGTNLLLLVVGEGPARADLEAHARKLGLTGSVRFAGKVSHAEIPRHVRLFDVALVTAINPYASPLKLFEYLAAAVPVVVVDQPNLREVLDESCALFFPAGDVKALARALESLAGDAARRAKLGEAGRRLLLARDYTWDGNVKRIFGGFR